LAIVTPFYPPHVGGVERYAQQFAWAAADLGLTVNVVTTDAVPRPIESTERGVRVLRLPAYNIPVMGSSYPISLRGWRRAAELLQCDAVMAHTRFFMTTPVAAALAARDRRRLSVVDHGAGPLRSSPKALAVASLAYEHAVTAVLKSLSPTFFAVSMASAKWLRRFGIADAYVLPNSISPSDEPPLRRPDAFDGKIVVLHVGRLLPEKGVSELVEAIDMLATSGLDIELRIAGEGPLRGELERRASKTPYVKFLGAIPHNLVESELDRATVYVHPSNLPEGFPTTLLEAGAAALPVISTSFGGSGELIKHGRTGWILARGEARSIATALEDLLAQPQEAVRRGSELWRLIQERYTWPATVRRFLEYMRVAAA
jgi:glycosyltransferase involved in cell wall biosynthesis